MTYNIKIIRTKLIRRMLDFQKSGLKPTAPRHTPRNHCREKQGPRCCLLFVEFWGKNKKCGKLRKLSAGYVSICNDWLTYWLTSLKPFPLVVSRAFTIRSHHASSRITFLLNSFFFKIILSSQTNGISTCFSFGLVF